jgi:hypothetical protein
MYFTLNNNKVVFAKYLINLKLTDDIINNLSFCQFEKDNIVVYDDVKLEVIKNKLNSYNLVYTIQELNYDSFINKSTNIKYTNNNEVINHLLNNIEPESVKKVRLEQENEDLKVKLQQTEDVLLTLMFGVK